MSTVLQSCQHHQHVRTLSRRACEAQIYEDEYSEVLNDTGVVERQCTQRSQRDRERQNQVVEELGGSGSVVPIIASHSELDVETHRGVRQQAQQRREQYSRRSEQHQDGRAQMSIYPTLLQPVQEIQMSHHRHILPHRFQPAPKIAPVAQRPYEDPLQRHDLGCMNVLCPFCSALHWDLEKVSDSHAQRPEFSMCCQRGQVIIHHQSLPPHPLQSLLESDEREGKQFGSNIRQYNVSPISLFFTPCEARAPR